MLALGLALVASLILVATIVQILHGNPEVSLSENSTQILIASVSGLTGVLGGYMGYRLGRRDDGGGRDALIAGGGPNVTPNLA